MAVANPSADVRLPAPEMAHPGYGKREAPGQRPPTSEDFAQLPEREAYIAAFIDRLPEGASMDIKTLAKAQPRYGQQAVGKALNNISDAGFLRRFNENVGEDNRTTWVTRTFFTRTPRDNDWWARFKRGDALDVAEPEQAPEEPGPEPEPEPDPDPDPEEEARSEAYEALAEVGAADHRMTLSTAECEALEPLAEQWLASGVSRKQLVHTLTAGLPPEGVHSPAALARRRLTDKMPAKPKNSRPSAPPRLMMVCTGCETPGPPEALPGGLCKPCRAEMEAERAAEVPATFLPAPAGPDIHAQVARLRAAARGVR